MPVVPVYDANKQKIDEITLSDDIFNREPNVSLIQEVIVWQLAKRRAGTACTKTRGEVSGGGKKPWRQKGTGRARAGSIRSPLWRGGGTVFGPKPRDYSYTIPKKVRKIAVSMALSDKYQNDKLYIIRDFGLTRIKTKDFVKILNNFNVEKTLILVDEMDPNVTLSARNIPNVKVLHTDGLNTYDIIKYEHLIIKESAINKIEERLAL